MIKNDQMQYLDRHEIEDTLSDIDVSKYSCSAGVVVLMEYNRMIYVVLGHEYKWSPFSGHCEEGESFALCAARELVEETCSCLRTPFNDIEATYKILLDRDDDRVLGAVLRHFSGNGVDYCHCSFIIKIKFDRCLPLRFLTTLTALHNGDLIDHQAIQDGKKNEAFFEKTALGYWCLYRLKRIRRKMTLNFIDILPVIKHAIAVHC